MTRGLQGDVRLRTRPLLFALAAVALSATAWPVAAQSVNEQFAFHDQPDARTQKDAF